MSIQLNFYLKIYLDSQVMAYAVWIFNIYSCKLITLVSYKDKCKIWLFSNISWNILC